jgi:hypothetical protein
MVINAEGTKIDRNTENISPSFQHYYWMSRPCKQASGVFLCKLQDE